MNSRAVLSSGAVFLGLAYFYGLILGAFSLGWEVLFRGGWPSLAWWQWVLAPLAIGTFAMCAEAIVEKIQQATGFGAAGQSRAKRMIHLVVLFVVLAAVIVGSAMYTVAHP